MFNDLTKEGLEETKDNLGGFAPIESNIYLGKIKMAYGVEADSGAKGVALEIDIDGREYRETPYGISGKLKGGKNYFEKDGKKIPLPGFVILDDLALICAEKELHELEWEEKEIEVWDSEKKAKVRKGMKVCMELIGKTAYFAILKNLEDKTVKADDGTYVPTGESRETNNIDKIFHPEMKITVKEAREGKTEPDFFDRWIKQNKDQVRDRRNKNAPKAGKPGVKPVAGSSSTPAASRPSLFGKKN